MCFIYCEIFKPWSRAVRRTYTLTVSCGLREGGKRRAVRCVRSAIFPRWKDEGEKIHDKRGRKRKCAALIMTLEHWGYQSRANESSSDAGEYYRRYARQPSEKSVTPSDCLTSVALMRMRARTRLLSLFFSLKVKKKKRRKDRKRKTRNQNAAKKRKQNKRDVPLYLLAPQPSSSSLARLT